MPWLEVAVVERKEDQLYKSSYYLEVHMSQELAGPPHKQVQVSILLVVHMEPQNYFFLHSPAMVHSKDLDTLLDYPGDTHSQDLHSVQVGLVYILALVKVLVFEEHSTGVV